MANDLTRLQLAMPISRLIMKLRTLIATVALQAPLQAAELIDVATDFGYTSELRTIRFGDGCPHCERYEWRLVSIEHGQRVVAAGSVPNRGHTVAACGGDRPDKLSFTVQLPRTGHYYIEGRGCTADACSHWVSSMDAAAAEVDCRRHGWWLYGHAQPPGIPVFTQE